MPATDKKTCLAIEDAVHPGAAAQLGAFGVKPIIPLDGEDQSEIVCVPLFSLGASDGHLARLPTGGYEYDLFPGSTLTVEFSIPRFTKDPVVIAGVYSVLGQYLARVREALAYNQGDALNARLPYHKLTHLVPAGTQLGLSEERGEDMATAIYRCTAGIRPDAWPLVIVG